MQTIDKRKLIEEPLAPPSLRLEARPISIKPNKNSRLVFVNDPHGLAVEQYKLLRRRVCAKSPSGGLILLTSPGEGEGKSVTSVNLAWCLAEGGRSTCLVDLDFRAPGVMATLGCRPGREGLTEVLAKKSTASQVMRQVEGIPLHVLGISERLLSPARQLTSPRLLSLLKELRETFEWVILDMAPTIPMSDVAEVLPYVDGAILVIRSGKTARKLVTPSLEQIGEKLWGVVMNDIKVDGSAYYGHYGRGKQHEYAD